MEGHPRFSKGVGTQIALSLNRTLPQNGASFGFAFKPKLKQVPTAVVFDNLTGPKPGRAATNSVLQADGIRARLDSTWPTGSLSQVVFTLCLFRSLPCKS